MAKVAILGQQGTGKSLLGIYWSRKIKEQYPTVTIYTNMSLQQESGIVQVTDLSQIPFNRSPKILIIDEAMFTLDSRSHSSKQNKVWTRAQAFFRKANFLLVFYLTHSADLIDNRMRKQLNYVVMCRKDKQQFQYLAFDMLTKRTKPFSLPKVQSTFDFANFDTHDFPPPISVDGLSENILFKIAK